MKLVYKCCGTCKWAIKDGDGFICSCSASHEEAGSYIDYDHYCDNWEIKEK